MNRIRRKSRGFFLADAITGLMLVTMFAAVLAVSTHKYHEARERLATDREATDAAQRALIALQMNQPLPQMSDVNLKTEKRDDRWMIVTATIRGRSVTLFGRLPIGGGS